MTDAAQGDTRDEGPIPPASTRWSEDAVQDEDALAPPFVPGREKSAPASEADAVPEPEAEAAPAEDEPFPFDLPVGADTPEESREEIVAEAAAAQEAPAEDDFPFEQFDIEGEGEEAAGAPEPDAAPDVVPVGAPAIPEADEGVSATDEEAGEDVAALLDRLARLLRNEGESAVRREMDSPDRLTALVAGVVSGYLSHRS